MVSSGPHIFADALTCQDPDDDQVSAISDLHVTWYADMANGQTDAWC